MGSKIGVEKVAAKRIGISYEEYCKRKEKGLKWCSGCKVFKPIGEFCRDSSRTDGLSTKCFQCRRKDNLLPDRVDNQTRKSYALIGMHYCNVYKKFLPDSQMTKNGICKKHANEKQRERYRNSPMVRMKSFQRNAVRKRNLNPIPGWYIEELFANFDGKCAYCSKQANTIDHIIPVSKGGNSVPGNIVPACTHCNSSKKAMDLFDWIDKKGSELCLHPNLFMYLENLHGLYSCAK